MLDRCSGRWAWNQQLNYLLTKWVVFESIHRYASIWAFFWGRNVWQWHRNSGIQWPASHTMDTRAWSLYNGLVVLMPCGDVPSGTVPTEGTVHRLAGPALGSFVPLVGNRWSKVQLVSAYCWKPLGKLHTGVINWSMVHSDACYVSLSWNQKGCLSEVYISPGLCSRKILLVQILLKQWIVKTITTTTTFLFFTVSVNFNFVCIFGFAYGDVGALQPVHHMQRKCRTSEKGHGF